MTHPRLHSWNFPSFRFRFHYRKDANYKVLHPKSPGFPENVEYLALRDVSCEEPERFIIIVDIVLEPHNVSQVRGSDPAAFVEGPTVLTVSLV
jgi:hypothetical protein